MSVYTLIVIVGTLMIIGGISLAATPLMAFMGAGNFIIILFFIAGMIGMIRAFHEKRYDKEFIFAILSLILGIAGLATPGAAAMNSFALLYMAAAWLVIHGILLILSAIKTKDRETPLSRPSTAFWGFWSLAWALIPSFIRRCLPSISASSSGYITLNTASARSSSDRRSA